MNNKETVMEHIEKGIFFAKRGALDEAIKEFKEAVRIDPESFTLVIG